MSLVRRQEAVQNMMMVH